MDEFPVTNFPVEKLRWRPASVSTSGGQTLTGPGQDASWDGGGWWVAELVGIDLGDEQALRAIRALLLLALGGVTRFIVPMLDWPLSPALSSVPHGDGSPFADSSEYVSGAVAAHLAADVSLRDTTIDLYLDPETAGPLQGGEVFTLVYPTHGPRIHMIGKVDSVTDDVYTVFIRPPIREDLAAEAEVDFNRPRCVMKLNDPDGEAWPWIVPGWEGKTDLRFAEAFDELS
ncbi:MAG: hypothetical protein KF842_06750 [Caulobacter sp.]|nr:hypothetical protein [Caulobacter sp.]